MKIKNIQLKSIEARRYSKLNERPQKIRIDHNSNITNMQDEKKGETLIDFQYTASYGPVGVIKIEGSLVYIGEDANKISKEWRNTRKMPDQIASQFHTAVMHACVPEAVGIAKDLALPPPIPLPQVKLGGAQPTKMGQDGPEVA
ncbi:hypothetical protein ACFL1L_04310 [Thermoplasmatota archaeon]